MKKKSIVILSMILASCGASKLLFTPSQSDVDRVATKYPGYTLAELNQGKSIYEQNCGSCHGLKSPSSETEAEWNHIVPEMTGKTNKKAGKEVINAKDQEILLKYLITMSSAPKAK
jgi:mono/diheme cytochrome c family protein